ncbi:MAG: rod shape-determining protein MreD [Chloroflexota bacterium]
MSRAVFGLLLVGAAILQASVLPKVGMLVVMPDIVLVLVLVRTAQCGVAEGILWSIAGGLVLDALALDPLGTNGLALLPVVLAGAVARKRFFLSGVLFPMLLAVVATVAHVFTLMLVRMFGGEAAGTLAMAAPSMLLQGLLNAMLVPVLWPVVGWLGPGRGERMA